MAESGGATTPSNTAALMAQLGGLTGTDPTTVAAGLDPNASAADQIKAYQEVLRGLNTELAAKQARVDEAYAAVQATRGRASANDSGEASNAVVAYNAAVKDASDTQTAIQRVNTAIDNTNAVLIRQQGKDQTPEQKAATVAATELSRAQVQSVLGDLGVKSAQAAVDAAQSAYDRDPNNPGSVAALKAAQTALATAQTANTQSATQLNSANAVAQQQQNQITALFGIPQAQMNLDKDAAAIATAQANVGQIGANTDLTKAQTYNQLFDYFKNQQMLPYDIAVQAANAALLQQNVQGKALANTADQRTLDAGGPEAGVANTDSATAVNIANAAATALKTDQDRAGARITQLSQISQALADGKIKPADAFNLYEDAASQSTAFERDKQASSNADTLFSQALNAGIFVPGKGGSQQPGGPLGAVLNRLNVQAPQTSSNPIDWSSFAKQLGVNITPNVPLPSQQGGPGAPAGGVPAYAQGYDPTNPQPITVGPDEYAALQAKAQAAAHAAATGANAQPSQQPVGTDPITGETLYAIPGSAPQPAGTDPTTGETLYPIGGPSQLPQGGQLPTPGQIGQPPDPNRTIVDPALNTRPKTAYEIARDAYIQQMAQQMKPLAMGGVQVVPNYARSYRPMLRFAEGGGADLVPQAVVASTVPAYARNYRAPALTY